MHADIRYSGDLNTGADLDPVKEQGSFGVANLRFGIGAADDRWQIDIWSRNVFEKDYRQVVFNAPLQTGTFLAFLGDPRTSGVSLRFNF